MNRIWTSETDSNAININSNNDHIQKPSTTPRAQMILLKALIGMNDKMETCIRGKRKKIGNEPKEEEEE